MVEGWTETKVWPLALIWGGEAGYFRLYTIGNVIMGSGDRRTIWLGSFGLVSRMLACQCCVSRISCMVTTSNH